MVTGLGIRSRATTTGMILLGSLVTIALLARWISPQDPFTITGDALRGPSAAHLFGTDDLGRDVFGGVVRGAWVSLAVGFSAAALSALIGIGVGGLAGTGRRADLILMRLTECFQALPRFFLVIALISFFGGRMWFIAATLGLTAWPSTARVFRAQVLTLMNRDFAYFTHATFDFQTSQPLDPPLDPERYLATVCAGVERHLLRRERSRRTVRV